VLLAAPRQASGDLIGKLALGLPRMFVHAGAMKSILSESFSWTGTEEF